MPMYSSNFLITKLSYHLNSLSSSVQFNHSIMSDSLQLHELQHARPPCPSPSPGVQTHVHRVGDAIQPSHPLSSTSPAFGLSQQKGLFKWVRLFALGGQSIGISASASIPPMNIQDWFPLRWTHWISLQSKGPSHHSSKASILWCSAFFIVQVSHPYMTTGKTPY